MSSFVSEETKRNVNFAMFQLKKKPKDQMLLWEMELVAQKVIVPLIDSTYEEFVEKIRDTYPDIKKMRTVHPLPLIDEELAGNIARFYFQEKVNEFVNRIPVKWDI